MEARLNYSRNFGNFSLTAAVGGNRMRQLSRATFLNSNGGLSLDGFYNISNSASAPTITTNEQQWGINSVFGLASFGWGGWVYVHQLRTF